MNPTLRTFLIIVGTIAWYEIATRIGDRLFARIPARLHRRVDFALFWINAAGQVVWLVFSHWSAGHWWGPLPDVPCVPPTCMP